MLITFDTVTVPYWGFAWTEKVSVAIIIDRNSFIRIIEGLFNRLLVLINNNLCQESVGNIFQLNNKVLCAFEIPAQ